MRILKVRHPGHRPRQHSLCRSWQLPHTARHELVPLQAAQAVGRSVVVDFNTSWCGPCRAMKPVLSTLAGEYRGKVAMVMVDCEQTPQNRALASEAAVRCSAVLAKPTALLACSPGYTCERKGQCCSAFGARRAGHSPLSICIMAWIGSRASREDDRWPSSGKRSTSTSTAVLQLWRPGHRPRWSSWGRCSSWAAAQTPRPSLQRRVSEYLPFLCAACLASKQLSSQCDALQAALENSREHTVSSSALAHERAKLLWLQAGRPECCMALRRKAPSDAKYRRLKASSRRLREALLGRPAGPACVAAVGFGSIMEAGEQVRPGSRMLCIALPSTALFTEAVLQVYVGDSITVEGVNAVLPLLHEASHHPVAFLNFLRLQVPRRQPWRRQWPTFRALETLVMGVAGTVPASRAGRGSTAGDRKHRIHPSVCGSGA